MTIGLEKHSKVYDLFCELESKNCLMLLYPCARSSGDARIEE